VKIKPWKINGGGEHAKENQNYDYRNEIHERNGEIFFD
jgi:hypothetical protein